MKPILAILMCLTLVACSSFAGTDQPAEDGGFAETGTTPKTPTTHIDASDTADAETDSDASAPDADADTCALYTHSTTGDAGWTDCTPVGTHTQDEALAACKAWSAVHGDFGCTMTPGVCTSQLSQIVRTGSAAPRGWSLNGTVSQDDGTGNCYADGTWQ